MYKCHDDVTTALTEVDQKPEVGEEVSGTCFLDRENNTVYIYTNKFSVYAIAASEFAQAGGQTIVGFDADVNYEVTIPSAVALTTKDAPVTANYKIEVTLADPSSEQNIVMKLTAKEVPSSASGYFNVQRVGDTQTLPYSIKKDAIAITSIPAEIVTAPANEVATTTSTLTYTLGLDPAVAGVYKDTLTFTISFVTPAV